MIGKKIGQTIYVHKDYIDNLHDRYKKYLVNLDWEMELYTSLLEKCHIIKVEPDKVTLIECQNFDKSLNPIIQKWHKFELGQRGWEYKGPKINSAVNPLILHRKELMVAEDYKGFSVELAKEWDCMLFNSGITDFSNKNKIGRLKYWKTCISKFENQNKELYNNFIEKWEKQF